MRGAPQYGFAAAIPLIKALTSELACGRPPLFRCEILVPIDSESLSLPTDDRLTSCTPRRQGAQMRESTTQNHRSFLRSRGTLFRLLSTPRCWRRARFSNAKSRRSRTAARIRIPSHRSVSIMGCSVRGTASIINGPQADKVLARDSHLTTIQNAISMFSCKKTGEDTGGSN
jgi:hypothetical protein